MICELTSIDIDAVPGLARLVKRFTESRRPQAIQHNGETVALLVPVARSRHRRQQMTLVDTTALAPVPYHSLEELLQDREPPPIRAFSRDEIAEAVTRDREAAWRAKRG